MIKLLYSLIPLALMVLLAVTAFMLSKLSKKIPEIEENLKKNQDKAEAEDIITEKITAE